MKVFTMKVWCLLLLCLCTLGHAAALDLRSFWMRKGRDELQQSLLMRNKRRLARNVIVFVGSGMGVSTVAAARAYKAELDGEAFRETQLNFEQFPNVALSKTYCADRMVCDSASTATAVLSGVKANFGTLGVTADVSRGNCSLLGDDSVKVKSVMNWFADAGKSVGLVTTSRVTGPVPAAAYAHSPASEWESRADMAAAGDECGVDIASQLALNNPNIQVVLGGGRAAFTNGTAPGHVAGEDNSTSVSADSQDLIEEWLTGRTSEGKTARYVWNGEQFSNVSPDDTDYLLGLFSPNEMEYEAERNPDAEPSIAEMTEKAIDILSNNPKGYFLLVHAGGIESGYRDNDLDLAVSETVALDDAVGIAMEMVDQDTLIVVTSDRAASVTSEDLGTKAAAKSIKTVAADQGSDGDSSNSTLANENGLQFGADNETALNTAADTEDNTATSEGSNPNTPDLESVGEDVPIYAKGPMSLLFHGVREQNFIAHALSFAACVGPNTGRCDRRRQRQRNWWRSRGAGGRWAGGGRRYGRD